MYSLLYDDQHFFPFYSHTMPTPAFEPLRLGLSHSPLLPSINKHFQCTTSPIIASPKQHAHNLLEEFLEKHDFGFSTKNPTIKMSIDTLPKGTAKPKQQKEIKSAQLLHVPPRPLANTRRRQPSSKSTIALITLLENLDNDNVREIQRVKESVKETRAMIEEYRSERGARIAAWQKERRALYLSPRKHIDDDVWLGL